MSIIISSQPATSAPISRPKKVSKKKAPPKVRKATVHLWNKLPVINKSLVDNTGAAFKEGVVGHTLRLMTNIGTINISMKVKSKLSEKTVTLAPLTAKRELCLTFKNEHEAQKFYEELNKLLDLNSRIQLDDLIKDYKKEHNIK